MSQRIKSNNEAGAAGDAATGRKGSQSSTVREKTESNSSQISILQHQRKFRIELSVIAFNKQENLKGGKKGKKHTLHGKILDFE